MENNITFCYASNKSPCFPIPPQQAITINHAWLDRVSYLYVKLFGSKIILALSFSAFEAIKKVY